MNESSLEQPCNLQLIQLISSLISLSSSVKVFSLKWKLITTKLEELLSSLRNFDSSESPLNSSAIQAIAVTVKNCQELAWRCVELSFSGKLLMQSDLDIVYITLEKHIKSLSDIYNRNLLTHTNAIVVSRPSISASRDDIEFYVVDLLSRFKIGDSCMKKQALIEFNEVIQEDDKYVKICVEVENFASLLVSFLDSLESDVQEEAAKAVSLIAKVDSCKCALISVGVISPLVRVLEAGSESSKEFSVRCLMKLTENSENAWSVSAHGGVTSLLKICSNGENNGVLIGLACRVLKNLVGVQEIKRFIIDKNAIPLFTKLVRSKNEAIQINSIDFLQTIALGDESITRIVDQEGGLRALIRVLDVKSSSSSKARDMALRGIMNLSVLNENSVNILMNYGFMDRVLYILRYGDLSVQELGLKAAFWLSRASDNAKKAMGDAGFITEMVKFLESKSFEIREMAAETLSSMIVVPKNRKKFVQNDRNVGLLLRMLDPEEADSGSKKILLSILMSLTRCNSARKKIVNSGYLKNIEKLAEAEILDAKKIVKKLSMNKFTSILTRFWNS